MGDLALAFAVFKPEHFPITLTARRASDHEEVWSETVEKPDDDGLVGLHIPALGSEHGIIEMRIQTANGVDSGWREP
jgi:hypothetical protein